MQLKTVGGQPTQQLVEIAYKVVLEPSERLTTDHVIRNKDIPSTGSQIVPQFDELKKAMEALRQRVALLLEYIGRVEKGDIKSDPEIMKALQGVTNRLPTMASENFEENFFTVWLFSFPFFSYILFNIFLGIGNVQRNDDDLFGWNDESGNESK